MKKNEAGAADDRGGVLFQIGWTEGHPETAEYQHVSSGGKCSKRTE